MNYSDLHIKIESLKKRQGNRYDIINAIQKYKTLVWYRSRGFSANYRDESILAIDNIKILYIPDLSR